jgi:stearoyl-CoA desaturase (delta-9 desaturase)
MNTHPVKQEYDWKNVGFFGSTTILAVVGLPLYLWKHDLTPGDWIIAVVMALATMMATTFGHHRLFAHKAFQVPSFIKYLCLFFGAAAWEGSVLNWSSEHRDHHRFVDTPKDPYNIKQGFWHAHMGWFIFERPKQDYGNAKDLSSDPWIANQHKYYTVWAVTAGMIFPLLLGIAFGSFWGTVFLGVCARLFVVHQCVFCINSVAHTLGKQTYDLGCTARDSFICAMLTHGEGYHSFHHRFPSDYRNGIRWYHWDPTKWTVRLLSFVGLATNIKRTEESQILAARTLVEKELADQRMAKLQQHPQLALAAKQLDEFYARLRETLQQWEAKAGEYRRMCANWAEQNSGILNAKSAEVKALRAQFMTERREWLEMISAKSGSSNTA